MHPADVKGRFTSLRRVVFWVLIVIYLVLPLIKIGGRPAVFLDVARRRFHLFGASFNAQDFWLMLFVFTGVALVLFIVTTLYGRVWCGYACPHTVFLEGIYRPIERLLEGPRAQRLKRNAAPMSFDKFWRKTLKHVLYVAVSLFISHFILSYFVSLPSLLDMMSGSPSDHPEAFGWMAAMSGAFYFNFGWFREQMCLAICPYGRLQSTLTDQKSLVVGYDVVRGEPRGKKKTAEGDCVDCRRCVIVCPTGIDIRNGLQMECIGCAACIDACDAVMKKLKRPTGLVRYDSSLGLEHREAKSSSRPRLLLYAGATLVWLVATTLAFSSRTAFEANILRPPAGAPFRVEGDVVRNAIRVHVVNKGSDEATFTITTDTTDPVMTIPMAEFTLQGGGNRYVPAIATGTRETTGTIRLVVTSGDESRTLEARFLGPGGR